MFDTPQTMRAVVYDRYGTPDVLEIREVPAPTPGRDQLLVRVHAAALNPKDVLVRKGKFRWATGRAFPRGVGYDWAGHVVAAGPGTSVPAGGGPLFGMVNGWRGITCAEYAVVNVNECARAPGRVPLAEAAAVPLAGLTALQALRDVGHVREGQSVCVNGGSGGVGTLAIQIACILGARVTSVSSARNLGACAELGAHETLDYARDDPFARASRYDVVFDVFGNHRFANVRHALVPSGTYVSTVPSRAILWDQARTSAFARQRARLVTVRSVAADLEVLRAWMDEGRLRPVVDRLVPINDIRDAQRYLETKRARGKVVITIG